MTRQRQSRHAVRRAPVIHVVDDEPHVLSSVLRLLRTKGYDARGFLSPEDFLVHYEPDTPGCVVLDVSMPAMTGLEVQHRLAASGYSPPIVFLTGHGDIASSVRAMRAGAVDFLTKPPDARDLLRAIVEALEQDARQRATRSETAVFMQRLASLTLRERQVFRRVVRGQMNKQIAGDLGISEKTVKVHRCRVMQKMRARRLAQLVHMADQVSAEHLPMPPDWTSTKPIEEP